MLSKLKVSCDSGDGLAIRCNSLGAWLQSEINQFTASVADSVKSLVMQVQSWNLDVKQEHQRKRLLTVSSRDCLTASAKSLGQQLPGGYRSLFVSAARQTEAQAI